MTDIVVERVRLRGEDSRRLARISATTLPEALERALGDLADARLGALSVSLDFDPADYDDHTVAALWAESVRAAALTAGATTRSAAGAAAAPEGPASAAPPSDDVSAPPTAHSEARPDPTGATLAATVRAWLDAGAPAAAVPALLAHGAHLAVAAAALAQLTSHEAIQWRDALAALSHDTAAPPSPERAYEPPPASTGTPGEPSPAATLDDGSPLPQHPSAADAAAARQGDLAREVERASAAVARLADLATGQATIDATTASAHGGLVLLYPWLAQYCEERMAAYPDRDPVVVRRQALSVLATGTHEACGDPLVAVLAGAGDEPMGDAPEAEPEDIAAAERVLAVFVGHMPGFEKSTPDFVRHAWISRAALVDPSDVPVRVSIATSPLDVMLPLLPYPLGGFRLPWTDVILTRMVP